MLTTLISTLAERWDAWDIALVSAVATSLIVLIVLIIRHARDGESLKERHSTR